MPRRDLNRPVTVINRFTVKGGAEEFEREFRAHSQYLRRRRDFHFLVTVRLLDSPDVYVHLSHWRSLDAFLGVVHDDVFTSHVRRLGAMVDTEADQAVSVGRMALQNALVGAANVVLLHANVEGEHARFEQDFGALTGQLAQQGGFGGSDLLRSTVRPQTYLGLLWWEDTEACVRALSSDGYLDRLVRLSQVARVTVERSRHVAYEPFVAD
ncbi:antibiotic biosynthesis monooxygenase family protein [Streptomyces sparsus]